MDQFQKHYGKSKKPDTKGYNSTVRIIDTIEKGKPYIQQSDQRLLGVGMGK